MVNNTGGSLTDVLNGAGGTITLQSTSNVLVEHNSVAGLTLKVTTSGITIRDNQITGAGIVIADGRVWSDDHGKHASIGFGE